MLSRLTPEAISLLTPDQAESLRTSLEPYYSNLERRLALDNLEGFMTKILGHKVGAHHREWMAIRDRHQEFVIEASRDFGKSWFFSCDAPLFDLQRVPPDTKEEFNIALVSYAEDQARKNLARIRRYIETVPELRWLYPQSKAFVWEAGRLQTSNLGTIETFGFGSSLRGGHYDRVIVDDPTKDHWTISVEEQENFFYGVLWPAIRKTGRLAVVGTPVDRADLMERLETNAEIPHYKFPCINAAGESLWPEQYTLEDLARKKSRMPIHMWMREFMLKRMSSKDATFRDEMIYYYKPEDILEPGGNTRSLFRVMTIDPALSPGGDALAVVATGTDAKGTTYVLDHMAYRGDFHIGIERVCDMIVRHAPNFLGFEEFALQNMYKIWLMDAMKRCGIPYRVESVGRDSHKTKKARIESLEPKLASGGLRFRAEDKPIVDQLITWERDSKHNEDDLIDALAWQVGIWRTPHGYAGSRNYEPKPGTFNDALARARERSMAGNYIAQLFRDFRG